MLKTKGIPLHHTVQGTGEAVLCLHGNRDSSLVFRDLAMALAPHYQVLCADLRAHGQSEYAGPAFTLEDMVDDILRLLDEQGLKQVSIIGHSLGSTLALLLSAREPDRVKKLVLMGAAATFAVPFKRPEHGEEITPDAVRQTNAAAVPYFFTEGHEAVQHQILEGWSRLPAATHRLMIQIKHPDLRPVLQGIRQRSLIITGEADRITPLHKALELNRYLPDSRMHTVPGAGHFMFLEAGGDVAAATLTFLKGE
ncbi:alpha/beta hydrolase [Paenibacillus sp. FSL R7-269]|uniref:alpha/beta fold hydrolase n=1 Tax=Paenibacillus sp. FSL R7-269 TaxID=1226755 RepID=UPI0003E28EB8|nr:alpha/beta hydrolase [Paenibacillus sp. FSL R7-269]ETT45584.1 alpha/beta hydrolase [Paenibacillus sp. FSL R7-269]